MDIKQYLGTFQGARSENYFSRIIILILSVVVLLQFLALGSKTERITFQPPGLNQKGSIDKGTATPAIKEQWAQYIATLIGNVTPKNAEFVATNIGAIVDPAVYSQVMDTINQQKRLIEDEQVTVQFSPTAVFYIPARDVVAVSGEYTIRGSRKAESHSIRTFEIGLRVRDYNVAMVALDAYEGPWRTNRATEEGAALDKAKRVAKTEQSK